MKLIIAGSRSITDYHILLDAYAGAMESWGNPVVTEIVSGKARGVDELGERFAREHNIPIKQFPAHWAELGRSAGYKRNVEMAEYADALLAAHDGVSPGTGHMIRIAEEKGLKVFVYTPSIGGSK